MKLHEALIEHEESNPRKTGQLTVNILQLLAEEDEEEND